MCHQAHRPCHSGRRDRTRDAQRVAALASSARDIIGTLTPSLCSRLILPLVFPRKLRRECADVCVATAVGWCTKRCAWRLVMAVTMRFLQGRLRSERSTGDTARNEQPFRASTKARLRGRTASCSHRSTFRRTTSSLRPCSHADLASDLCAYRLPRQRRITLFCTHRPLARPRLKLRRSQVPTRVCRQSDKWERRSVCGFYALSHPSTGRGG
jgi:hypothetical protein